MASRTQIVCVHEGKKGQSIDAVFINALLKKLKPSWIGSFGSNWMRFVDCGGRTTLIKKTPAELKSCLTQGGNTTLMVWADVDDDMEDGEALRKEFWKIAEAEGITREQFDKIVFIFPKDRLEN